MTKRQNNSGSIYFEKARSRFQASFVSPDGKRVAKRFITKDEAEAWLTMQLADIYRGTFIAIDDITYGEWLLKWLELYCQPNVNDKTYLGYLATAKHLEPLYNLPLQKMSSLDARTFLAKVECSDITKRKIYHMMKSSVKQAYDDDFITKNFMSGVKAPKVLRRDLQIFTQEEITKILEAISKNDALQRYYTLFLTYILTGARAGEILALHYNNIGDGYIEIKTAITDTAGVPTEHPYVKTDASYRRITISKDLEKHLRSCALRTPVSLQRYVFHTKNGTPYSVRNTSRTWRSILKAAGVAHRKLHALRHTHATQLLAHGIPLLEVAKRLGHSKPSHTLNLYGHYVPGYDQGIPDKVDAIFLSKGENPQEAQLQPGCNH